MRILVVDDEPAVREALRRALQLEGYDVELAGDGVEALERLAANGVDAVLLDVMMPRLDGLETCRRLRRDGNALPVLMLTARDAVSDRVAGLDAGADDYVVKPFAMDELLARLRAAIRRGSPVPVQPTVITDAFTIDLSAGRVTAGGDDVKLTPTEWHLLEVLARNPGRVLGHEQLLTEVWGPAYREQTNYLRVYIATLRRKREPDAANPRHLLTEAGRGYRFQP